MSGIKISEKYGVNPTIPLCFVCGKPKNEIILTGRLHGDVEAPKNVAWDKRPCDECKKLMGQGIILISVKEDGGDHDNPYRTGGWCVIKEEAAVRMFKDEAILKSRMVFVVDEAWDMIGLPRG